MRAGEGGALGICASEQEVMTRGRKADCFPDVLERFRP